jgi:hypothetical protein
MIEAMACETTVIAYRQGSVSEAIEEGVTGFIVHMLEEVVRAGKQVVSLSRRQCREVSQERFSARRMADDYGTAYRPLVTAKPAPAMAPQTPLLTVNSHPPNVATGVGQASGTEG